MAFSRSDDKAEARTRALPRTLISRDLVVRGTILTDGEVDVDGSILGDVCAKAVNIGTGATVKGRIVAESVSIAGAAEGRVTARRVRLLDGAAVRSDLIHQRLAIEDGAEFEGSVLRKTEDAAWDAITATFEIEGVELTEEALRAVRALDAEFDGG